MIDFINVKFVGCCNEHMAQMFVFVHIIICEYDGISEWMGQWLNA